MSPTAKTLYPGLRPGSQSLPHLLIAATALLLILPAVFTPPMTHDSFWIDWVWADQFNAELSRGNLYPRWLPLANGGVGSPTFYFYPPLSFFISGVLGLFGLSTYATVIGSFGIGFLLSGYAMLAWLREAKYKLLGSLFYMVAPYHVVDFYGRGALAECLGVAFIPLVALGIRRASERRPGLLAFAYAGLILTHLPLALLTSFFFVVPYCLWRGQLRRYLLPLSLGIAMAAIYLIPALALQEYRHSELLWTDPKLQPRNWNLVLWHDGMPVGTLTIMASILAVLTIPTVILWFAGQRRIALYAGICLALAAGITPLLWSLPLIRAVQFPFRVTPLAEFAIATGVASAPALRSILNASLVAMLFLTARISAAHPKEEVFTMAQLASVHPEVLENRLTKPGPLPSWPERAGLLISFFGLAATVMLSVRANATTRSKTAAHAS